MLEQWDALADDEIEIETSVNNEIGLGYDAGIRSDGTVREQLELLYTSRHCMISLMVTDSRDIDRVLEFFQQVKRAREALYRKQVKIHVAKC